MAPRRRVISEWPAWRYGPEGESGIFECEEDVPSGWMPTPDAIYEPPAPVPVIDYDDVANQLATNNIDIDPRWGKAKLWEELQKVLNND